MVTRESHSKSVSEFQCVPLLTSKGLIVLKCWPDQGTDQFEVESNTERFSIREVAHREVCMSAPSDNSSHDGHLVSGHLVSGQAPLPTAVPSSRPVFSCTTGQFKRTASLLSLGRPILA